VPFAAVASDPHSAILNRVEVQFFVGMFSSRGRTAVAVVLGKHATLEGVRRPHRLDAIATANECLVGD
jgi:hypothetical protein